MANPSSWRRVGGGGGRTSNYMYNENNEIRFRD